MVLRILTWNLKHGRAEPSAGRDLTQAFSAALAGWEWDVALLQEVPPWWPPALAAASGARHHHRSVLTSRNAVLPARRALATRWPDVMKSNGGGANAIVVRGGEIAGHRRRRLCWTPERRWLHAVRLEVAADGETAAGASETAARASETAAGASETAAGGGDPPVRELWVGNLHATAHHDDQALRDDELAARTLVEWAADLPCVLGGDFNLRRLTLEGFAHAGGHDVDHVFMRGLAASGPVQVLERGRLSDHAPVLVTLDYAS